MEEEEKLPIVSGKVENIIIKLEPTEDFLDDEDSEDKVSYGEFFPDFVSLTTEENESDIIQTPFSLESYFDDRSNMNLSDWIDSNYWTCVDCKIVFPTERSLQEHLIMHIDIHKMGCNVCDKDLNIAEKFQLHVMAITRQSIYFCDLCKKSCAGVVRLKHQTRPLGKTYACHDCEVQATGKPYISNDGVLRTNKIKNENFIVEYDSKFNPEKSYHKCEHCNEFFSESLTLSRHLKERHNHDKTKNHSLWDSKLTSNVKTEKHQFKCNHCEEVFPKKPKLTKHLNDNHKPEKYKSKKIKSSINSKVSPKNKFKCNQCDVSYSENFNLTKHLCQKHKKDKQKFTCKLCLKEFTLQRCYENHVSFHEISQKNACFACKLTFTSNYELQQHSKIHKQVKKVTELKGRKTTLTDINQKKITRRSRMRS